MITNEQEMKLAGRETTFHATRQVSNDAWFDKLALDKAIGRAIQRSYNICFVVFGEKGSGRDYCLTGGTVVSSNAE